MKTSPFCASRALARIAGWLGLVAFLAAFSGRVYAFDLKPSEIRGKSSKEPLTVLQNRYFLKSYRPEVGLVVGSLLDEAYLDTQTVGARSGMFLNEWLGFEVQMLKTVINDSDDRKALNSLKYKPLEADNTNAVPSGTDLETETIVSPDPEVNAILAITDFNVVAAPFYGKLNLLNKWIIYTDLYLTGGLARLETDQGDKAAVTIGGGERFYIGKSWSIRIDYKDRIFTETRAGKSSKRHSNSVDFGASYFFN